MNLPTISFTQADFEKLPVSQSSAYDQAACRWLSRHGQWIYINKDDRSCPCGVISISEKTPSGFVMSHDFDSPEEALAQIEKDFGSPKKEPCWTEEDADAKEAYYRKYMRQDRGRADHGRSIQQAKAKKKRRAKRK
jgi:hypothetical protein